MTPLNTIIFLGLVICACICVILYMRIKKQNQIIDALNITLDFSEEKVEELGKKYYSLTSEISRTRSKADRFSGLIEHIPFALWQRNNNLDIIYTNDTYMTITGEEQGRAARKIFPLYKDAEKLAKRAITQNKPQTIRKHIIAQGQQKSFEINEIPLEDGTFGFAFDLSEIEALKNLLAENTALQTDLLESASSAITIYGSDQRLKYFNHVFVNLWGFKESFLETCPTYGEILEDMRERGKLPEQSDFRNFKRDRLSFFTNLRERDEEIYYLPDERTLRVIAMPAQQGGLLISYKDISDQMTLERSYNTLMSVRAHTLDNLTEGIAVLGEDGKLQIFNPIYTKIWQLDEAFLESRPHITDILSATKEHYKYDDDWELFERMILSLINNRVPASDRLIRNDGSTLLWTSTPLPDGGLLLTYTDITDSAKVEESLLKEQQALREAETIKNNFLANVSYKLRSPLTSISGFAEMLISGYFGELSTKQAEYVKGITSSSDQLASLIDNILDITSIDAGQMRMDIKEFDIYEAVNELPKMMREYTERYHTQLTIKCRKNIGTMIGDKKRIIQIIRNMLRNSFRFINDTGTITLAITSKEGILTISVADDGKGITKKELAHVFDRFNKQTSYGAGETGLGLTVAKSFVELHGGAIDIKSKINKGTTITCTIPQKNKELLKL